MNCVYTDHDEHTEELLGETVDVDGRWGGGHGHHHHVGHRRLHCHSKSSKSCGSYGHMGGVSKGHGGYNNKPHRPSNTRGGYGGHHQHHRPDNIEIGYDGGHHHQVQHLPGKGLGAGESGQQPSYFSQPHGGHGISDHRRPHIGGTDAHGLRHPGGSQGPQYGRSYGGFGASQAYHPRDLDLVMDLLFWLFSRYVTQ